MNILTNIEQVILVDEQDQPVGVEEKLKAHELGLCHRAFSVFLYRKVNDQYEILLQQRALGKYHCGGLWTNTCCSHPRPGEEIIPAAQRRLNEELGINADLHEVGVFHYISEFSNGLTENEVDHVVVGEYSIPDMQINPDEVAAVRWVKLDDLSVELSDEAQKFTPWFSQAYAIFLERIDN